MIPLRSMIQPPRSSRYFLHSLLMWIFNATETFQTWQRVGRTFLKITANYGLRDWNYTMQRKNNCTSICLPFAKLFIMLLVTCCNILYRKTYVMMLTNWWRWEEFWHALRKAKLLVKFICWKIIVAGSKYSLLQNYGICGCKKARISVTYTFHIQVLLLTDTMRFHLRRYVDGVTKQAVAWHLAADHAGYDRSYAVTPTNMLPERQISACYLQSTVISK